MRRPALPLLCSLVSLLIARAAVAAPPAAAAEPSLPASWKATFTGTLGKVSVVMTLERDGRHLKGNYRSIPAWTAHFPPNGDSWVDGSVDQDGRFALKEEVDWDDHKAPAKLVGRVWMGPAPEGLLLLEGSWSHPRARPRAIPLAAQERRPTAAEARITTVKRVERKRIWKKIIVVNYPEVRDAAGADQSFNTDVRKFVETDIRRFKAAIVHLLPEDADRINYELTFEVRYVDERIVSLRLHLFTFCAGPHPDTDIWGYVFDRATGKRMKLADLFLPGSPYRRLLSKKLGGDPLTIKQSFSNWHVDAHGLWFAFVDGNEVDNDCEHFVPWTELRAVIDPAGPAGKFLAAPVSGP
jgi:hypothetical protein